jgi:hypothetical protein
MFEAPHKGILSILLLLHLLLKEILIPISGLILPHISWTRYWHFERRTYTVISVMALAGNSESCSSADEWKRESPQKCANDQFYVARVPACSFDWVWWMSSFTLPVWKYSVERIEFILMPQCRNVHKDKVLTASLFNVQSLIYNLYTHNFTSWIPDR